MFIGMRLIRLHDEYVEGLSSGKQFELLEDNEEQTTVYLLSLIN